MIKYDEKGIIETKNMSFDEQEAYLRTSFISFCNNKEVKINAKKHGECISGASGFNFPAEIAFKFNELKIEIKWKADYVSSKTGSDVFRQNLQYGKIELNTKVIPNYAIIHICYEEEVFAFAFADYDNFNKCLVCTEYMKELLLKAKISGNILAEPSFIIPDDVEERQKHALEFDRKLELERKRREEEKIRLMMEQRKEENISNFKNRFLREYRCPKCGRTNMWYDMDFDVDQDEDFQFSASCKVCDRLVFEYGNINTYQIQYKPDQPIQKAPWETQYLNHPCPYCGAYKVRYAKWDDKGFSVAFWGVFSHKLHSNYKCDSCKKMWE